MSNTRQLDDWIESYLKYVDNSEPPEIYHIWTAVSTIAAALQRKCVIRWGHLSFYPNMYIVLVGPPGKARKGTAMNFGKNFLSKLQIPMAAESITREALIRDIKENGNMDINEGGEDLARHSSYTIFSPELVVFLGYNNEQLIMDLTDWFDCGSGPEGRWTYRTKQQGTDEIIGVWVNLIGATTPDLLRTSLSQNAVGGGLTSRIIFVYAADKGKTCPVPFMTKEQQKLEDLLYYDLERIHMMNGQFKLTKGFINLWTDWYTEQDRKQIFSESSLQAYCERRQLHVIKLSMILSAAKSDSMIISEHDLSRAIKLLEHTEKDMPKVFAGVGKSQHGAVITDVMHEIGLRGEILRSDLVRLFYHDADSRVMDLIIRTLKEMNFITVGETPNDAIIKLKPTKGGSND